MLRILLYPPFLLFDFVFTTFLTRAIFFGKQTPVPPLLRYLVSISPPLLKVSKWKCIVST